MPAHSSSSPITPASARGASPAAAPPETPTGRAADHPTVGSAGPNRPLADPAGSGEVPAIDVPRPAGPADPVDVMPTTVEVAGSRAGTTVPAAPSASATPPAPPVPSPAGEIPLPADLAALRETAVGVLRANDLGDITRPSPTLYPHQWLWDSCFIAIGLRHLDPARAAAELLSLLRGQWPGGMIPHVIFAETTDYYHAGPQRWRCDRVCTTAGGVQSTGVTQPPMIAEAAVRVGEAMTRDERVDFYRRLAPGLIRFHEWLYRERDPDDSGLVALVHSWESGMDNTPTWMEMTKPVAPRTVRALRRINGDDALDALRRDSKEVPPDERLTSADLFTLYRIVRELRRSRYDFRTIRDTFVPLVQDVAFNAILIRANEHLVTIADEAGIPIPRWLSRSMRRSRAAMSELWSDGLYFSRDFRTGELLHHPTIASFLPLYAGVVPDDQVDGLVKTLLSPRYWARYGIASVPTDDPAFLPRCYWQGPVWVNMNWLIADGLDRYGRREAADAIRANTVEVIRASGSMFEYYSPLDGSGAGSNRFSWTSALLIDILATHPQVALTRADNTTNP
ncbi:Glycosyl hydrolase family 63 C-terminal domain-containing protein [Parafrankia irregularis]|uniref:Glycosyl hydrolase family 63 C-terminal domain-containing protein n=2 Tax=Parafrankia TaxID=2994362 RepID=A0A0S4QMB9_9ACTN|nr:trehalase family glycosidase [Parafrankia irregularis]CUU55594.1 Glycosyl hydrolase family 63 C-terminal domain-containing protein [Parafrankia irregularis]